jgi:hypothetical protein
MRPAQTFDFLLLVAPRKSQLTAIDLADRLHVIR